MSIFTTKQNRLQMFISDDGTIQFRKLPVLESSLVEKDNDKIVRAWPLMNKTSLPFSGYKGISGDRVLMSCERDIILDPFSKLTDSEKPEKGKELGKAWVQQQADTVRYKHQRKHQQTWITNAVTIFLGCSLVLELLVLGMKIAFGGD